jgi:hypothetical protein
MNTRAKIIAAAFALAAAAGVNAQSSSVDKAFTANGNNCLGRLSRRARQHPKIASAARKSCRKMARLT